MLQRTLANIGNIWLFGQCQLGMGYGHDGYPAGENIA
jgi:hypothetical protein